MSRGRALSVDVAGFRLIKHPFAHLQPCRRQSAALSLAFEAAGVTTAIKNDGPGSRAMVVKLCWEVATEPPPLAPGRVLASPQCRLGRAGLTHNYTVTAS